ENDEEEESDRQGKSVAAPQLAVDSAFAAAVVKQEASREERSYNGPATQCHGVRPPLREPTAAPSAPRGNYGAGFVPAAASQLVAGSTRPPAVGVARLGAVLADGSAHVQAGKLPPSRHQDPRPPDKHGAATNTHAAPPTPTYCTDLPDNTQPADRCPSRPRNNTILTTAQHTPLSTPVVATTYRVPDDEPQPLPFNTARPSRRTAPCAYNICTGTASGPAPAPATPNQQPGPQNVTRDELLQVVQALTDSKSTTPVHYTPPTHISRYTTSKPMEMKAWLQQLKAWFRACHLGREFWAEQVVAWMDARMAKEIADVPIDDFDRFEKALLERYASPDASVSAFEDLQATRQKANESCRAFMWKVQRLVRKAYPEVTAEQINRIIVNHFVTGLRDSQVRCAASMAATAKPGERVRPDEVEAAATRAARAYGVETAQSDELFDEEQPAGASKAGLRDYTPARVGPARGVAAITAQGEASSYSSDSMDEESAQVLAAYGKDPRVRRLFARRDRFGAGRSSTTCRLCHGPRHSLQDCPELEKRAKTITCFRCGQVGHFKFQCEADIDGDPGPAQQQHSTVAAASDDIECFNCGGHGHMQRECPSRRRNNNNAPAQTAGAPTQPRSSTAPVPSSAATSASKPSNCGVITRGQLSEPDSSDSDLAVTDTSTTDTGQPAVPDDISNEPDSSPPALGRYVDMPDSARFLDQHEPASISMVNTVHRPDGMSRRSCRTLFWVPVRVQGRRFVALADTGADRNCVRQSFLDALQQPVTRRPPNGERILGANGQELELDGTAVLEVEVQRVKLLHEYLVCKSLPVDIILSGELMKLHESTLRLRRGRNRFDIGEPSCTECERLKKELGVAGKGSARPGVVHTEIDVAAADPELSVAGSAPVEPVTWEEDVHVLVIDQIDPPAGKLDKVLQELKYETWPVNEDQRGRARTIIEENLAAFAADDNDLGRARDLQFEIDTGAAKPVKVPLRRLPHGPTREFVQQEIKRLLELGVIRPSKSEWRAPVVVVKKKDGSMRMCVDYRWLNAVTRKDQYPLPIIQDIFDSLHGARYFTSLDLVSGYYQVPVAGDSIQKTAFATYEGLYEFTTMPFGLSDAPPAFQRLMNTVFQGYIGHDTLVYLDDIINYDADFEAHLQHLDRNLKLIIVNGLKIKPRKCEMFRSELIYLGHRITPDGIGPDPAKVEKVRKWPKPETGLQMASFLGLCNYYRNLVGNYSEIALPLYATVKAEHIEWTPALEAAFDALKEALASAALLHLPDPARRFVLETDASQIALGGVLKQEFDGVERPVAFFSAGLNKSQRNYSTYERELFAVVRATDAFSAYLLAQEFTLRTDHSALRSLFRSVPKPTSRIERWQMQLQPFKFTIEVIRGKENVVADALSRIEWPDAKDGDDDEPGTAAAIVDALDESAHLAEGRDDDADVPADPANESAAEGLPTRDEIADAQANDALLRQVRRWVEDGHPDKNAVAGCEPKLKALWQQLDRTRAHDGLLVVGDLDVPASTRVILPDALVPRIVQEFHAGRFGVHQGAGKLLARIKQHYYWPAMRRDIDLHLKLCPTCEKFRRAPAGRAELTPIRVAARGELVVMDVVGGGPSLPTTSLGNKLILTIVDAFTKYAEAIAIPDQTAETLADAFEQCWLMRYGTPMRLLTDQGRAFQSERFLELCSAYRIEKVRTTSYHPQGNGGCERFNRTLKEALRRVIDAGPDPVARLEWDRELRRILFVYNTTVHSATGESPFALQFGRIPSTAKRAVPASARTSGAVQRAHEGHVRPGRSKPNVQGRRLGAHT
ncbi:MAG: hypothetical protein FD187_3129, partial [bacterium]